MSCAKGSKYADRVLFVMTGSMNADDFANLMVIQNIRMDDQIEGICTICKEALKNGRYVCELGCLHQLSMDEAHIFHYGCLNMYDDTNRCPRCGVPLWKTLE